MESRMGFPKLEDLLVDRAMRAVESTDPWVHIAREDGVMGLRVVDLRSSNVRTFTWYPSTNQLEVEFGRLGDSVRSMYRHEEVPLELFAQFIAAKSRGSFFARNIKGRFNGQKVR